MNTILLSERINEGNFTKRCSDILLTTSFQKTDENFQSFFKDKNYITIESIDSLQCIVGPRTGQPYIQGGYAPIDTTYEAVSGCQVVPKNCLKQSTVQNS